MKQFFAALGLCIVLLVLGVSLLVGGCACNYAGRLGDVVSHEVDPATLLKRYEWFKDAAASLEAKQASIAVYEGRFERLKKDYEGKPRSAWSREDREQTNLWEQEVAGLKASYNRLASEYNAAMSKENWRYCEQGRLPPGAATPLPRAFKPYETK